LLLLGMFEVVLVVVVLLLLSIACATRESDSSLAVG
jgi:competence protein ComGC